MANSTTGYSSLSTAYIQGNPLSVEDAEIADTNEFLSALLNSDRIISIGAYLFKINFTTGKVFVLPVTYKSQINDLKLEKTSNPNIHVFYTDNDVLELIEAGILGSTSPGTPAPSCSQNGAPRIIEEHSEYNPAVWGTDYRQANKVVYQKAEIYFSLQTKIKTQHKIAGTWFSYKSSLGIDYYCKYQPKCKSDGEASDVIYDTYNNSFSKRPYERSRQAAKYIFTVRFFGLDFWSTVYDIRYGY